MARTKKLELKENADGVLGVIISRDQYREYLGLQEKRDRSIESMRARMRANAQNALKLSRKVLNLLEMNPGLQYDELYELANEILATE